METNIKRKYVVEPGGMTLSQWCLLQGVGAKGGIIKTLDIAGPTLTRIVQWVDGKPKGLRPSIDLAARISAYTDGLVSVESLIWPRGDSPKGMTLSIHPEVRR